MVSSATILVTRAVVKLVAMISLLGMISNPAWAEVGIRVSGNQLLRDGVPFIPLGFTMVGLLSPTQTGLGGTAGQHYGQTELNMAKAWKANTLRFQVSQRGFDPQDSLHTAAYIQRVKDGVALARQNGFAVILSMQDQSLSGGDASDMPEPATLRSWDEVTKNFNGDPYIMYELWNEPMVKDTAAEWVLWQTGGTLNGQTVIGHQALLDRVRASGATNVVIAEGTRVGKSFIGCPGLNDPQRQLAYGIHPYLNWPIKDPANWNRYFGDWSGTYPVIATEWSATSGSQYAQPEWPTLSPTLLDYLKAHKIGVMAWAFDILNTLIKDWSWTPTNFVGFTVGVDGNGPGELVKQYFTSYDPTPTPTPTNFQLKAIAGNKLQLSWQANGNPSGTVYTAYPVVSGSEQNSVWSGTQVSCTLNIGKSFETKTYHVRAKAGDYELSSPTPDLSATTYFASFDAGSPIHSSPSILEGRAYVGDDAGMLHCVQAYSPFAGQEYWRFQADGAILGRPAIYGPTGFERIYFGTAAGSLYCLGRDGSLVNSRQIASGAIRSTPAIRDGYAYVGADDGSLYRINLADWEDARSYPFGSGTEVGASPAVPMDTIRVLVSVEGSSEGDLYCLNSDLSVVYWTLKLGTGVTASPVIGRDQSDAYIGSANGPGGAFYRINVATGSFHESWPFQMDSRYISVTAPVSSSAWWELGGSSVEDRLYFGAGSSIYGISAANGLAISPWPVSTGAGSTTTSPIALLCNAAGRQKHLYIGAASSFIAVNMATGDVYKYTTPTGSFASSSPAASGVGSADVISIGNTSGTLYFFTLR